MVSEAILIKKAWAFITNGPVEMIASRDSSVARAVAQRAGVGRVRPLQTSCLWIQMWTANKELKLLAIPTDINPADAGTKVLTGARLKKLCGIMGMVNGSGSLLQDDSKSAVPKGGNATKVLMMVQALLATQLEGCDSAGTGSEPNLLSYLIEVIYFVGYTFSLVGDGYLYVLFGVVAVTVVFYLLVGTTWRLTFVLEPRSSSTGPGPGYAGRSSEGALSCVAEFFHVVTVQC